MEKRGRVRGTGGRHSDSIIEREARVPARVIARPEVIREAAKLFAAGKITAAELSQRLRAP